MAAGIRRPGRLLTHPPTTCAFPHTHQHRDTDMFAGLLVPWSPLLTSSYNHPPPEMATCVTLSPWGLNTRTMHKTLHLPVSKSSNFLWTHITEVAIVDPSTPYWRNKQYLVLLLGPISCHCNIRSSGWKGAVAMPPILLPLCTQLLKEEDGRPGVSRCLALSDLPMQQAKSQVLMIWFKLHENISWKVPKMSMRIRSPNSGFICWRTPTQRWLSHSELHVSMELLKKWKHRKLHTCS